MPVSVGSLSDIKQPDIWSDWFAGLADLNEHVPVNLGYLASRYTRPQMEAVTVLGDNVGYLALLVQHEQCHVGSRRLGQTQVTGGYFFTLEQYFSRNVENILVFSVVPDQVKSKYHWDLCSQEYWHLLRYQHRCTQPVSWIFGWLPLV